MPHTDLLNVQYSLSVSTNSQTEVVVSSSQENASAISFEFIGRGEPWNKANFLFFFFCRYGGYCPIKDTYGATFETATKHYHQIV